MAGVGGRGQHDTKSGMLREGKVNIFSKIQERPDRAIDREG